MEELQTLRVLPVQLISHTELSITAAHTEPVFVACRVRRRCVETLPAKPGGAWGHPRLPRRPNQLVLAVLPAQRALRQQPRLCVAKQRHLNTTRARSAPPPSCLRRCREACWDPEHACAIGNRRTWWPRETQRAGRATWGSQRR